jgi:hypothetical protein
MLKMVGIQVTLSADRASVMSSEFYRLLQRNTPIILQAFWPILLAIMEEFISERMVQKVRKYHTCSWCAETIKAGESAYRSTSKQDGSVMNLYMHPECRQAFLKSDVDNSDGWYPGDFKRGSCEANG